MNLHDETGATLIEYGLLISLIAVACIGAVFAFGVDTAAIFTNLANLI